MERDQADVELAMVYLSKERKTWEIKASRMKVDLDRLLKELETKKTHSARRALKRNELKVELASAENCAVAAVAKATKVEAGADKAFRDGYCLA